MINIAHKKQSSSSKEFLQTSITKDNIQGFDLDVLMTKDKKIIYFTLVEPTIPDISQIQSDNYKELKEGQFLTLEDALDIINKKNEKQKITINIISVYNLTEFNLQEINERNNDLVKNILNIISSYKNLDFYLYSGDTRIVSLLKQNNINNKIGMKVSEENLNFQDVDFYVIRPTMLNEGIIDMLQKKGKNIMVNITESNDFVTALSVISENTFPLKSGKYKGIFIISRYPEIINKMINTN